MTVVPPGQPDAFPPGGARDLQSRMARFTDGPGHTTRRDDALRMLPDASGLAAKTARRARDMLTALPGTVDVMPLARAVPVAAFAEHVGVPQDNLGRVTALTGDFSDTLTPTLQPRQEHADGDAAATELTESLARTGPWDGEQVAAVIALLFQARDATAALIDTALTTTALCGITGSCLRRCRPVRRGDRGKLGARRQRRGAFRRCCGARPRKTTRSVPDWQDGWAIPATPMTVRVCT